MVPESQVSNSPNRTNVRGLPDGPHQSAVMGQPWGGGSANAPVGASTAAAVPTAASSSTAPVRRSQSDLDPIPAIVILHFVGAAACRDVTPSAWTVLWRRNWQHDPGRFRTPDPSQRKLR